MQYTIEELRQEVFAKVLHVYSIFQDYFGEDKTDLQNYPEDADMQVSLELWECTKAENEEKWNVSEAQLRRIKVHWSQLNPFILVYWPEVTVTNEHDRSIVIQDLYAKVEITMEGRIPYENRGFQLVRTTFPQAQFVDGYMHSHVPHFVGTPHFENPCLGRGPIKQTIMSLMSDCDDMAWMMFCRELSMYVTVESLVGVPYNKLEEVGKRSSSRLYGYEDYQNSSFERLVALCNDESSDWFLSMIREFTDYYLKHGHLTLCYDGNRFLPGMPYFDFTIDIANAFIDWYNQNGDKSQIRRLFRDNILLSVNVAGGKFYQSSANSSAPLRYEGDNILTFKGEQKQLHIFQEHLAETESTLILNWIISMYILENILKIINYRYRNEHNNRNRGSEGSAQSTASPYQRVLYL